MFNRNYGFASSMLKRDDLDVNARDANCGAGQQNNQPRELHLGKDDGGGRHGPARGSQSTPEATSTVRLLLESGDSPVDKLEGRGMSALHFATQFGCLETCKLLIEYGADPNLPKKTFLNLSSLGLSVFHGRSQVLSYITLPCRLWM